MLQPSTQLASPVPSQPQRSSQPGTVLDVITISHPPRGLCPTIHPLGARDLTQCPSCHSPPSRSLKSFTDFSQAFPPAGLASSRLPGTEASGGPWAASLSLAATCRSGRSQCVPSCFPSGRCPFRPFKASLSTPVLRGDAGHRPDLTAASPEFKGTGLSPLPGSHSPGKVLAPASRLAQSVLEAASFLEGLHWSLGDH